MEEVAVKPGKYHPTLLNWELNAKLFSNCLNKLENNDHKSQIDLKHRIYHNYL